MQNVTGVILFLLLVSLAGAFLYKRRRTAWAKPVVLKILLGFLEMITLLEETFNFQHLPYFSALTGTIRALFANVAELSALSCAVHVNRYAQLLIWTLGMLVVAGGLLWRCHRVVRRAPHGARER